MRKEFFLGAVVAVGVVAGAWQSAKYFDEKHRAKKNAALLDELSIILNYGDEAGFGAEVVEQARKHSETLTNIGSSGTFEAYLRRMEVERFLKTAKKA